MEVDIKTKLEVSKQGDINSIDFARFSKAVDGPIAMGMWVKVLYRGEEMQLFP